MKRIILFLLCFLSFTFLLTLKTGYTTDTDYQIYGNLAYSLMHGASYGHDIIDTKLDPLLWIYALIMKVFTQGQPYFAMLDFFTLIPILISLVLVALISKKIFYKKIPLFLPTFIFLACTYQWRMNSEILVNVFTLLALYFFINKKGKFGNNFFLTGFFLGLSMLLRLTNGINILTFPLTYFLITYTKENSFKQNIVAHIKQYPTYLKYTLGCIFPFLLYFIYISYTNNWSGFYNYILYISHYNHGQNSSLIDFLFVSPKKDLLHVFFLISMIVVYRYHKKLFIFALLYFILNFLTASLCLSRHYSHYYIQVMLIYPFVITQAITITFNNLKNKKHTLTQMPYFFITLLSLISLVWLPLNTLSFYPYKYLALIKNQLHEKGYSYKNYLKASDTWLCKQEQICQEADFLKTLYPKSYTSKTALFLFKENNGWDQFFRWHRLFTYIKQLNYLSYSSIKREFPESIIIASDLPYFNFQERFLIIFSQLQRRIKLGENLFGIQNKNLSQISIKKENYTLKKIKKTLSNGSIFNVWVWNLKKQSSIVKTIKKT